MGIVKVLALGDEAGSSPYPSEAAETTSGKLSCVVGYNGILGCAMLHRQSRGVG